MPAGVLSPRQLPDKAKTQACSVINRVVEYRGMRLRVPDPGYGVGTETLDAAGASSFRLSTAPDGTIDYATETDGLVTGDADSGALLPATGTTDGPPACQDEQYNIFGAKKDNPMYWTWGNGPNPGGGSDTEVTDTLRAAAAHIERADDCGMADQVSANAIFDGYTTRETEFDLVDGGYECESAFFADGYSVVDAGNLDNHGDPPVAAACWWTTWSTGYDRIYAADIRFNTTDFDFTFTPGAATCPANEGYDLQSVAVHEFGHAFGMAHVREDTHGYLTMSTRVDPCTSSQRTLGKGDILGLRDLY